MASKRTFHRKVLEIEILSEWPYEAVGLEQIANDITYGDCSGKWVVKVNEEIDGPRMAQLLLAQGSDPGFFQLDNEGNDTYPQG